MALASFCGLLTLQVGCAVIATTFFVVGVLVFGINIFTYSENPGNSWPVNLLLVCVFVILLFMVGILIFLAAYYENRKLCLVALCVLVVITLYWFILTLFSLLNTRTDVRRVCVDHRCGESFWLSGMNYRRAYKDLKSNVTADDGNHTSAGAEVSTDPSVQTEHTTDKTTTNGGRRKRLIIGGQVRFDQDDFLVSEQTPHRTLLHSVINALVDQGKKATSVSLSRRVNADFEGKEDYRGEQLNTRKKKKLATDDQNNEYVYGAAFAGAIIFSIVNLLFFLYSMIIVWSYAQELKFSPTYYYDSNTPSCR